MKNARFSDAQIMVILRKAENGVPVSELCREHGMSSASFYKWRATFGGTDASMLSEMKAMSEGEPLSGCQWVRHWFKHHWRRSEDNGERRLKRMYAEMSRPNDLLKEAFGK